jgi:hypothetical protein
MNYEFEDYTPNEIEDIIEYWQDISQDPVFIADEIGMEFDKVVEILEILQGRGEISGFSRISKRKSDVDDDKVLLFEELISPEMRNTLTDNDYFFDEKEINEIYEAYIFEIKVTKSFYKGGMIFIPLEVTIKGKSISIFMVYSPDENVYYDSETGDGEVDELRNILGSNWKLFDEVTEKILSDNLPEDFWQVRLSRK